MSRTYLAGAMDREPDGGVQWRDMITPWLNSRGIIVFNPIDKPCSIGLENAETRKLRHEAKMQGDLSLLIADKVVRAVDLRIVDVTDFTIVNLSLKQHPCGTYEELFWANREKKPIIVRCEEGKLNAPDWLFWTIPHELIFSTWDEVKAYVDHIAFDPEERINSLKRWIFFDLEGPTKRAEEAYRKEFGL